MVVDNQTRNNSQEIERLHNQAIAKHKAGKDSEAVDIYLAAIALDSQQPGWVYGNLVTLLAQQERLQQGLELGKQGLSIHPRSEDLHRAIAIVWENLGDSLNCIQHYQQAISIEPKQPDWLYCNLTKQLLATEQYDLAVKTGSQGVKMYGGFYPLQYALGNAFAAQQDWEQAILAYQKVQQLNPHWLEVEQKLNQAIYHQSRSKRQIGKRVDLSVAVSETGDRDNTPLNLDINSLFARLREQQLYVSSCQQLWQKIPDAKQTLNAGFWLSPSILYLEITINSNYLFTDTAILVCGDRQYAVAESNFWQISPRQYAGIACFTTDICLEEYASYRVAINDNNTLLLVDEEISAKAYNLEFIEYLKHKSRQQQNLIRESVCSSLIESVSPQNQPQVKDILHKLQYFLDIDYDNFVDPNLPFKIFIDNSIPLKSEGLFTSGWLHDPYQMLEKITAVSALGFSLELDKENIYRWAREDVKTYLQNTRYGGFEDKLGFCAYLSVPETIQTAIQDLAELHSLRYVVSLKGNIEVEIAAEIQHGDYNHARQQVMQLVKPQQASEVMLTNCLAPVALKLQQLCMAEVKIREVVVFGQPVAQPTVSLIIPLYRRLDFLKVQLATMALDPAIKQCELIYVLDSPEQEAEVTACLEQYSALYQLGIKLIVMQHNSGYAAANNAGASQARGKYLVLLNSDVFAKTKGWMLKMAKFYAQSPQVGTLGAKLIYEDDSLQHAGMFFAQTTFPFWITLHYHKGLPQTYPAAQHTQAVPTVTGACLMIARKLYKQVGGLTTDYIIGDFEDSDLCLKCQELGYESWYFADATLYHLERQSVPLNTAYNGSLAWQLNARLHHQRWGKQIARLMKLHQKN